MLWIEAIKFYCFMWWQALSLMPDWWRYKEADATHFHRRRFTQRYRAKLKLVRNLWCGSAMVVLAFPFAPLILVLALLSTFIAFAILDDTL